MTTDGGGVAALGFRYQYLATAEEILLLVATHPEHLADLAVIVEPTGVELGPATPDDDVVDIAIEQAGQVTRRVQVKSSRMPSGMNPLRYSDITRIFDRMGADGDEVAILTNKPREKAAQSVRGTVAKRPWPRRLFRYSKSHYGRHYDPRETGHTR